MTGTKWPHEIASSVLKRQTICAILSPLDKDLKTRCQQTLGKDAANIDWSASKDPSFGVAIFVRDQKFRLPYTETFNLTQGISEQSVVPGTSTPCRPSGSSRQAESSLSPEEWSTGNSKIRLTSISGNALAILIRSASPTSDVVSGPLFTPPTISFFSETRQIFQQMFACLRHFTYQAESIKSNFIEALDMLKSISPEADPQLSFEDLKSAKCQYPYNKHHKRHWWKSRHIQAWEIVIDKDLRPLWMILASEIEPEMEEIHEILKDLCSIFYLPHSQHDTTMASAQNLPTESSHPSIRFDALTSHVQKALELIQKHMSRDELGQHLRRSYDQIFKIEPVEELAMMMPI